MAADDAIKKCKISFLPFWKKVCLKTRPGTFFRKYLFLCQISLLFLKFCHFVLAACTRDYFFGFLPGGLQSFKKCKNLPF